MTLRQERIGVDVKVRVGAAIFNAKLENKL